ncbi:MAG: hypothetical protein WCF65_09790 [Parachlamydiaceae bacterium]
MLDKKLNGMMDCIKSGFIDGCQRGLEFRTMRHGIIIEMMRLGFNSDEIKEQLLEWNKRCEKVLGPSEAKTQLSKYVDWVFKLKEARIGCRAMHDYCIGPEKCSYFKNKYVVNRKATQRSPEYWTEVSKFLQERFKADGYTLMMVLQVLSDYQHEKGTGEVIFIGYRKIAQILAGKHNYHPSAMEVCRKIAILIEEGILEMTIKGKPGMFTHQANGYRFLPWQWPGKDSATITHINPYV